MTVLKQRKIGGERRVFQDRSVCLHNTEKSFLCVRFARKQHRVFLQYYRLVRNMKCQTSHRLRVSHRVFLQYIVSWRTRSVKHHSHRMLPQINLTSFSLFHIGFGCQYICFKCLIILLLLLHFTWHVSITHVCSEKPTFALSFIYMCAIIWPPAPLKICYLARHLKEVARAWCRARRLLVGKTQMTCIERFGADKAAVLGEWNSGDRVDIKYRTWSAKGWISLNEYKYSRTVQYLSCYVASVLGLITIAYIMTMHVFSMNMAGGDNRGVLNVASFICPPVPLMSGHLSCTDTSAWSRGCPFMTGTTVPGTH